MEELKVNYPCQLGLVLSKTPQKYEPALSYNRESLAEASNMLTRLDINLFN
jgi:hypothetical protein